MRANLPTWFNKLSVLDVIHGDYESTMEQIDQCKSRNYTKHDFIDNDEQPFRSQYEQAYKDLPFALRDAFKAKSFF